MKIVAEISCEYPEIAEKMNKKAHKISSTHFLISRPNQDEQKISKSFVRRNQVWTD
jgi:hypothetical protein